MSEQIYKDKNYDETKLELFAEKRRTCVNFDIKIQFDEDNIYFAHRHVLMLTEGYFKAILSSGMKESQCDLLKVQLPTAVTNKIFGQFLNYFYFGTICINKKNVKDIAIVANFLSEWQIRAHCIDFLISIVNVSNAIELENFARNEGFLEVLTFVKEFIYNNFYEVAKLESFKHVSFETFRDLMSSKFVVNNEMTVLKAIFEWFLVNKKERTEKVLELVTHLNFGWLTSNDLSSLHEETEEAKEFMKIIIEHKKLSSDLGRFSSTFKRSYWGRYIVVKKDGIYYHWFGYSCMEKVCDADFSDIKCSECTGKVYILDSVDDSANNSVFYCYDLMTNTLKKLAPMIKPIKFPTVHSFGGKIYVFDTKGKTYQVYSPDLNTWKLITFEYNEIQNDFDYLYREPVLYSSYSRGFVATDCCYRPKRNSTYLVSYFFDVSSEKPCFYHSGKTKLCTRSHSHWPSYSRVDKKYKKYKCKQHSWRHLDVIENYIIVFNDRLLCHWLVVDKEEDGGSFHLLNDEDDVSYELQNVSQQGDRLIIRLIKKAKFRSRIIPSPVGLYLVVRCSDVLKNIQKRNAIFTMESISEKLEYKLDECCDLKDAEAVLLM